MSTLPNVSSIYRDLSHLYESSGHISSVQQVPSYSLESPTIQLSKISNMNSSYEDMYTYKLKRHNELMSRFKNSANQQNNLISCLNGSNNYASRGVSDYGYSQRRDNNLGNQPYQYSSVSYNTSNDQYQRSRNSNFVIPKIRYRHIQGQRDNWKNAQNNNKNRAVSPLNHTGQIEQLQRQFYQDNIQDNPNLNPNLNANPNLNNNNNNSNNNKLKGNSYTQYTKNKQQKIKNMTGIQTQTQTRNNQLKQFIEDNQQDAQKRSQISQRTNTFIRSNKNAKYQDKIESYYDLCRKNLQNKNHTENQISKNKDQKFIRNGNTKVKAMKLDQAIKLLTLD